MENNSNSNSPQWKSNFEDVSTTQLDKAFSDYVEARNTYEQKNKIAKEAYAVYQELEFKFTQLLQSSGKSNWNVDGMGKVSEYERTTYTTPKSVEDKKKLAEYLGKERFWDMFSVNSQTLNSWAKAEKENGVVEIPGLGEPTTIKKLRLTRSKK